MALSCGRDRVRADSGLVRQPPSLLGPAGIMDHVANRLKLGVDLKQEPHDRAEGDNRQEKEKPHLANLPSEPKSTTSAERPLIPQQATFWMRLGMSQGDPGCVKTSTVL